MKIIRGRLSCSKKILVYGPEGIGKSTFASRFPEPVFIDTEGSTKDMDVARFEKPSSWTMLTEQIRYVKTNPTICRTLVIDTADWAEQMCIEDLCSRNGKRGIEDFGYGNGYVYAKEEFGRFLNLLSEVVEAGVHVVVTAHAQIRKFEQPDEMGSYDRYELKLGKKTQSQTSPLLKEWADMVLFCNYKTFSVASDDKGKHKAQGGRRVMYTSHHPCWDAKNRYGLPEECEFDYSVIRHIIEPGSKTTAMQPTSASAKQGQIQNDVKQQKEEKSFVFVEQMTLPLHKSEPLAEPFTGQQTKSFPEPDPEIPKALRDLMVANQVDEWEIQNIVAAKGYFPEDVLIRDYPMDFIEGVLVGAWRQVFTAIKEMRENQEIPFN